MAKKSKSRFNVNDISTWPFPVVLLFSIAIAGIILLIVKQFLVNDLMTQKQSANTNITKEEQLYAKSQKTIALLPHIKKEVAELEVARDEAKKYLPTEISMPGLIDNVYLAARDNGIVFNKFTPEKDIDKDYYTIKPITLSADVGYLSMSSFIEQVTTLQRIMNVHSVSFTSNAMPSNDQILSITSDEPLKMSAQLRTYIFKDSLKDSKK